MGKKGGREVFMSAGNRGSRISLLKVWVPAIMTRAVRSSVSGDGWDFLE